MRLFLKALSVLALAFAAGCQGYKVVQTVHFIDDDGRIIVVDYGESEKDHVSMFTVPPLNGRPAHEEEFPSKLAVNVTLPDGDDFTAWKYVNLRGRGTMYRSDNEKWFFRVDGFTCEVIRVNDDNPIFSTIVFRGVLCNTQPKKVEKDERWRKLKPGEY